MFGVRTESATSVYWTVTSGQSYAAQVNYVALPTPVQMQALQALNRIK